MLMRARYSTILSALSTSVAVLLFFTSPAAALPFNNLIVFGDSLVDTGNTQALAVAFGFDDPTPASVGYFEGRFTNGINPADVLNQAIEGTNAVGTILGGENFAFGGARARASGFIPHLGNQVGSYLTETSGIADSDSLYLINIGGNDVRDIVIDGLTGAARQAIIDDAVAAISLAVSDLQAAGAANILFAGVGDVGSIPEILAIGGSAPAEGRQASIDLNAAIVAAIGGSVTIFDTLGLFDAVNADPTAFGFPVTTDFASACTLSGLGDPAGAPTCAGFGFFDEIHPTTQALQLIGNGLIAAVPEPGTGLLLMLGLGGLGMRRRAA